MAMDTATTVVFASSAAAAEHVDALRGRLTAHLAHAFAVVGAFARRRRQRDPLSHETVALALENRRIAARLRADSQRGAVGGRLL